MPNIDSGCVLFGKITEHVCRITLNRPDVGNAGETVYLEPGSAYAKFAAKVKDELEAAGKLR
jgi:hypothetical protein